MLTDSVLKGENQAICSNGISTPIASNIKASSPKVDEKVQELIAEEPVEEVKTKTSDELNVLLGDESAIAKKKDTMVEPKATIKPIASKSAESSSFLNAPEKSYTLNITTTNGLSQADEFVSINGLDKATAYTYEFGPDMKSAKVIYGIFSSVKEANEALKSLPASVIAQKPYIDNISKHQNLYNKYHK